MIPVVDTHIHLYDSARLPSLPWPPTSDKLLYRSYLADDYNKVIVKNHLAGVIVVEASPRVSDNDWVLYHTQEFKDKYLGLVGALEFDKETFKEAASYPNVYCKVTSLIHECTVVPAAIDLPYLKKRIGNGFESVR